MLRVAFTTKFERGKMEDLVALLSGRNFKTRKYEDATAEESFRELKISVLDYKNESNFKRFTGILRSGRLYPKFHDPIYERC